MKIHCEPFKGLGSAVIDLPDNKKCPYSGVFLISKAKEALKAGATFAICRIFYMVKKVEKKEFVDAAYLFDYWNKKLNFYRPGTKEKLKEAHIFVITSEKEGFQFKEKTTSSLVKASWRNFVAASTAKKTEEVLQFKKVCLKESEKDSAHIQMSKMP